LQSFELFNANINVIQNIHITQSLCAKTFALHFQYSKLINELIFNIFSELFFENSSEFFFGEHHDSSTPLKSFPISYLDV
jgi:alpha-tubulin suppressor-like RCC1 family protein